MEEIEFLSTVQVFFCVKEGKILEANVNQKALAPMQGEDEEGCLKRIEKSCELAEAYIIDKDGKDWLFYLKPQKNGRQKNPYFDPKTKSMAFVKAFPNPEIKWKSRRSTKLKEKERSYDEYYHLCVKAGQHPPQLFLVWVANSSKTFKEGASLLGDESKKRFEEQFRRLEPQEANNLFMLGHKIEINDPCAQILQKFANYSNTLKQGINSEQVPIDSLDSRKRKRGSDTLKVDGSIRIAESIFGDLSAELKKYLDFLCVDHVMVPHWASWILFMHFSNKNATKAENFFMELKKFPYDIRKFEIVMERGDDTELKLFNTLALSYWDIFKKFKCCLDGILTIAYFRENLGYLKPKIMELLTFVNQKKTVDNLRFVEICDKLDELNLFAMNCIRPISAEGSSGSHLYNKLKKCYFGVGLSEKKINYGILLWIVLHFQFVNRVSSKKWQALVTNKKKFGFNDLQSYLDPFFSFFQNEEIITKSVDSKIMAPDWPGRSRCKMISEIKMNNVEMGGITSDVIWNRIHLYWDPQLTSI